MGITIDDLAESQYSTEPTGFEEGLIINNGRSRGIVDQIIYALIAESLVTMLSQMNNWKIGRWET